MKQRKKKSIAYQTVLKDEVIKELRMKTRVRHSVLWKNRACFES